MLTNTYVVANEVTMTSLTMLIPVMAVMHTIVYMTSSYVCIKQTSTFSIYIYARESQDSVR